MKTIVDLRGLSRRSPQSRRRDSTPARSRQGRIAGQPDHRAACDREARAAAISRNRCSENLSKPAIFAGYLNMRAAADYSSQSFYGPAASPAPASLSTARRAGLDIVLESSATFDMDTASPAAQTRFVYDMPEQVLRIQAGDVTPLKDRFPGRFGSSRPSRSKNPIEAAAGYEHPSHRQPLFPHRAPVERRCRGQRRGNPAPAAPARRIRPERPAAHIRREQDRA